MHHEHDGEHSHHEHAHHVVQHLGQLCCAGQCNHQEHQQFQFILDQQHAMEIIEAADQIGSKKKKKKRAEKTRALGRSPRQPSLLA